MLKKLRIKFIFFNMLLVTLMICIILGLIYYFTKSNLESESINMMQSIGERPFMQNTPQDPPEGTHLPYFRLQFSRDGELTAEGSGYYDLSDTDFLRELVDEVFSTGQYTGVLEEYNLRFCVVANPQLRCIVFADISSEITTLNNLIKLCAVIGVLSFFAFFIITLLIARWAVKPIERAWQQQQQFVADASHELKTPLTVIMTNAELLQSPDYDESSRRQFSENILTMSRQMRSLVEDLLELARSDNEQSKITFSKFNFSALVENALLIFEPIIFEKEITLTSLVENDVHINANAPRLQQVLDILLDNAQKYTAANGWIRVELARCGRSRCRLAVSNTGSPLSQDDLKSIFKRFYRADKARVRDGSFGLGLSIAENIVLAHHGRIWAESKNNINSFYVELQTV